MKVLHGLDKVVEGGAVVLTLKDQSILAGDDVNQGNQLSDYVCGFLVLSLLSAFIICGFEFCSDLNCIPQRLMCLKMWRLESRSEGMTLTRLQKRKQGSMMISKF